MLMKNTYLNKSYRDLSQKYPHEREFLQAVHLFFNEIEPVIDLHPEYQDQAVLERLVEPERAISFRVPWVNDQGKVKVNTGYRVQFSSVLGPYKGGIRFDPSVNLSILKFLGFEQTFKNALTGLPMGGGKGGADFDPRGKSDQEIMRFCQSFMTELYRHIGPDLDVPAGDIGVAGREIGYLYGQYKRLQGPKPGVLTGKPVILGGNESRPPATGYGLIYFLKQMLAETGQDLAGKTVMISGAGNVASHACRKAQELGAHVVTLSDIDYAIYDPKGIDLELVIQLRDDPQANLADYSKRHPQAQVRAQSVWDLAIEADIALPCATQNEMNHKQVKRLLNKGLGFIAEGANMPLTAEACRVVKEAEIPYAPGKASNAGGVAVSGLEMCQNAARLPMKPDQVDQRLQEIMTHIFSQCKEASLRYGGGLNYAFGADIASFEKVVEGLLQLGVV
ncbi:NADP-specific glutamate dehydrogenase [Facklamia hominis]